MNLKKVFNILILVFTVLIFKAQDPIFVQFSNNPIYLNSSLAGEHKYRITSIFSQNWSLLPKSFNNQIVAYDMQLESKNRKKIDNENSTFNFLLMLRRNSEGDLSLNTKEFKFGIGYRTDVASLLRIGFGISTKIGQKTINWNNAVFVSDLDPIFGQVNSSSFIPPNFDSFWYKNAELGLSFRIRNHLKVYDWQINGGISFSDFIPQKNSFFYNDNISNDKLSVFLTFMSLKNEYRFNSFYQKQLFSQTFQLNGEMKFRNIIGGVTIRTQFYSSELNNILGPWESLWFNFNYLEEFEDFKFLNISYSFGVTLSELGFQDTFLSHEISLKIFRLSENELSYSHEKDWFCPGDKGVRRSLNLKKQNIDKYNKKKAKKNR
jgi:type IX secretion system PorP/SprF family membrane protein